MATNIDYRARAAITIPADYLESWRIALIHELDDDGEILSASEDRDERSLSLHRMRTDVQLLGDLFDATGDTTVEAERAVLTAALDQLVRSVLAARIVENLKFTSIDMAETLDVAERLRWTAEQAARLQPGLYDVPEVTVTLTREQRDAMRDRVDYLVEGEGGDLPRYVDRDRPEARAIVRRLGAGLRLLDLIGWEAGGTQDTYTVPLDGGIVELAGYLAELARGCLEDDARTLKDARGRPAGVGDDDDLAVIERVMARDRRLVEVGELVAAAVA